MDILRQRTISLFRELSRRPLPVQFALLRRFLGVTQEELGESMGIRQTHVSRMEKDDSDHLISLYEKAARKLGAHLALVLPDMVLVPKKQFKRWAAAQH